METDSKYLENKNCSKPCSVAVCITLLLSLLLPVQKNRLLADFTDILTQCPFQKSCRCSTEIRNPFPRHKRNRNCRKANQLLKNNLVRALQHTVSLPKLLSTGSASEAASHSSLSYRHLHSSSTFPNRRQVSQKDNQIEGFSTFALHWSKTYRLYQNSGRKGEFPAASSQKHVKGILKQNIHCQVKFLLFQGLTATSDDK